MIACSHMPFALVMLARVDRLSVLHSCPWDGQAWRVCACKKTPSDPKPALRCSTVTVMAAPAAATGAGALLPIELLAAGVHACKPDTTITFLLHGLQGAHWLESFDCAALNDCIEAPGMCQNLKLYQH